METFEALVNGTVYRNEENGYSVVSVQIGRSEKTVVGVMPALHPGEQAAFEGEWVEHSKFGKQFKCTRCTPIAPTTLLGIERFLGSGAIKGVGRKTAKDIVAFFGEDTLVVLATDPERLQEIPGMGKKRWRQIAESFQAASAEREAMIFLQQYGITAALAARIGKLYGDRAREVVQNNPYRLCEDLEGVGFVTADRIAAAMGIAPDSENRIRAALRYLLQEAAGGMGHVFLYREELIQRAASLLNLEEDLPARQLRAMTLDRDITLAEDEEGRTQVWLPHYEAAEREVAQRLCELMAAAPPGAGTETDAAIARYERSHGVSFSPRQREAIASAVKHGVLVITGGPGTGKTTIINCILQLLSEEGEVSLCAPTGRAAKRMTEATGREAKTIHRLLEYGGEEGAFARNAQTPLETDCVIVDEASMIDLMLMRSLLRAIEPGSRLVIVGDSDQLPSVGPGNVLGDILDSGVVPSVRLHEIFRQAENSRIVVNAHRINRGEMPLWNEKGTDFFFERTQAPYETAQKVVSLVTQRLPGFLRLREEERARRIQVLAPARKGDCGVIALNAMLQQALNPAGQGVPELNHGGTIFRRGDKVMQVRNNYDLDWTRDDEDGQGVFNGDIGYILAVDRKARALTVEFDDGRVAEYDESLLDDLELAYCMSVHKSQGSEFDAVVLPLLSGPPMLMTRNLLYTAITRAKRLVVIVGREDCLRRMVDNDHIALRYSALDWRLRQEG